MFLRRSQYLNLNGRLAQFRQRADRDHWEERWARQNVIHLLEAYKTGKLDEFEDIFCRFLPRHLPIVEAGCGMGQLVMALASRGYCVEGVDYAERTIARIKEAVPTLNVRSGDVYNLDAPDDYYGGYISIGLFEHNEVSPLAGLQETCRVLHPEGVALISVPYLNRPRRKWAKTLPSLTEIAPVKDSEFYQYYYDPEEFEQFVSQAGMKVIERFPYAVYAGLTRDYALGRWLNSRGSLWRIQSMVSRWSKRASMPIRLRYAHMMMFVCKKLK